LWAGIIGSAIGVVAFILASAGLDLGGAEVSPAAAERLTQAYGAYGVMEEPNIFGSFTGALLVVSVVLVAALPRDGSSATEIRLAKWTAAVSALGLVFSFTRAAWIGAALGLVGCLFAVGKWTRRGRRRVVVPVAIVVAVGALLMFLPGTTGDLFRFKLLNLVNLQSQTAILRLLTYSLALDQTATHPILGWGTFTFAPLTAQGNDFQQFESWRNFWIGNFALLALHDTGAIGLLLWIGMLWTTISRGARAAVRLRAIDVRTSIHALALVGAVVSLLIPFLTTTGFSLGYPWLLMGLLGAHSQFLPREHAVGEPEPPPTAAPIPVRADAT
jgi:O-antigen ligase